MLIPQTFFLPPPNPVQANLQSTYLEHLPFKQIYNLSASPFNQIVNPLVYNPFSLLNVFRYKEMQDYWFRSGTPTYLLRLLSHTQEGLDEMTGRYYFRRDFIDYKATVEKPLPMIYQSGYLTIKDYNWEDDTFLLDFPNNEVKAGFLTAIASDYANLPLFIAGRNNNQ